MWIVNVTTPTGERKAYGPFENETVAKAVAAGWYALQPTSTGSAASAIKVEKP